MSTPTLPGFGQFIPGFDFLRQLTQAAGQAQQPAGAAIPGMPSIPSWSDWVAPTLQPEELQKRIGELKTVQFWLEQNNRAVAATVQALEVQKMTLSTLKNMGVPFEQWTEAFRSMTGQATDAASQFWRNGADGAAALPANPFTAMFGGAQGAASEPAPAPAAPRAPDPQAQSAVPDFFSPFTAAFAGAGQAAQAAAEPPAPPAPEPRDDGAASVGGADPLKWWGALTGQFQEIARGAMQDLADRTATQVQSLTDAASAATDAAVAAVATAVPQVPAAPRRRSAGTSAKKASAGTAAAKRAAPAPAPAGAARKAAPSRKAPSSAAAPRRRASGR
jgi:hypothetical protein